MGQARTQRLQDVVGEPEAIDGEVVDIDMGYEDTVVLTVESDGEQYVEEYDLASVKKINTAN